LPRELAKFGYVLDDVGTTERILPAAIPERFVRGPDGELQPLTAESTRPVAYRP
jgi:hypothetical protein